MLGIIQSAAAGGTAWTFASIGSAGGGTDTGFLAGLLANNSTDIVQLKIQVPHRRKLLSNLDSFHMHVVTELAMTAGQTVIMDQMSYQWIRPGDAIAATASWIAIPDFTYTAPVGGHPANTYHLWSLLSNIAIPAGWSGVEGYGGMILLKIRRGNGTHTGRVAVLDVDAHTIIDRMGSLNEATD
jgi:hypothetical protein